MRLDLLMALLIVPRRFVSAPLFHSRVPSSKIRVRVGFQNPLSPSLVTIRARSRHASNSMSQPSSDAPTVADSVKAAEGNDVLVQYVVLRRDLIDSWPLGSVVTQGCHASVAAVWENKDDAVTAAYCSPDTIDSMHKVTLEVKGETQILNLSEKLKAGSIAHKLWTEQPENIPTCLATKPYPKSVVSSYFRKLKLCK